MAIDFPNSPTVGDVYTVGLRSWIYTSTGWQAYTAAGNSPSAPGLAFITQQTFSTAASVSVNNCFTSAYDSYRVIVAPITGSIQANLNFRLRVSSTDSSASYYSSNTSIQFTGTNAAEGNNNASAIALRRVSATADSFAILDIMLPALTKHTFFTFSMTDAATYTNHGVGKHTVATAYDGFTLVADSGNLTGTLRVYGFRNS